MKKHENIINLSTIFSRGNSSNEEAQEFFKDKNHEGLIGLFIKFLGDNQVHIGHPKITPSQALNDHGVDIILEFPDTTKIGIQIKSPIDVASKDFAPKVKAQMSESKYHGVEKWYLFICSPISGVAFNFTDKIGHLINELSGYKTSYHAVYTPQQTCNILRREIMDVNEFHSIKNQFSLDSVDWKALDEEIMRDEAVGYFINKDKADKEIQSETAEAFTTYLGWTEPDEIAIALNELSDLRELLSKLPKKTRVFLSELLRRAKKKDTHNQTILATAREIENYFGGDQSTIQAEVAVLKGYNIAEFDNDQDDNIWYIAVRKTNPDYNILEFVRDFSKEYKRSLDRIIIDLDFSYFD